MDCTFPSGTAQWAERSGTWSGVQSLVRRYGMISLREGTLRPGA
jgi:hypothetical protein